MDVVFSRKVTGNTRAAFENNEQQTGIMSYATGMS